ncbi:MAG: hypothetical protein LBJ67_09800 [Planctomycetaceae bacterium]|jgi:hypothetical protein|nr:hypothetical protein [Planctomycetaceae bacterium]
MNETVSDHNPKQRYLDFLWCLSLGGIGGEFVGMIIGRYCLSVELMYLFILIGIFIGVMWLFYCRAYLFLCAVCRNLCESIVVFFRPVITAETVKQRLEKYKEQRRWIASENIIRRFLAKTPIFSPELAAQVRNISQGIECCKKQWTLLFWHFIGGSLFLFVSYQLYRLRPNFPEILSKSLPTLNRWNHWIADSLLIILWFILISFVLIVCLIFLRKHIAKWGYGWAISACVFMVLFPLIQYGLAKLADLLIESNLNASQIIRNYFITYLPTVQYWFTVYAMLGVIYLLGQNLLDNENSGRYFPPFLLFVWVVLIILSHGMKFAIYSAEAFFFLFLLSCTGMLYHRKYNAGKQPYKYWLLVPFCCVLTGILNTMLESAWLMAVSVSVTLFISGFLIVSEKGIRSLCFTAVLSFCSAMACQLLRWYNKENIPLLTILAVWSVNGFWLVNSQIVQFDAAFSIKDQLYKTILRWFYQKNGFGVNSLMQTDWYENNRLVLPQQQIPPKTAIPPIIQVPPTLRENKNQN